MKKNKMMRLASLVLVLTLMSTCAISGTFAKYVTVVSGQDEARTAVWDITADFEKLENGQTETMFKAEYKNGDGESAVTTVKSAAETTGEGENQTTTYDKVVAPGTSDDYTYGMTGTPEVAYKVSFALDTNEGDDAINTSDITLKKATYKFTDAVYQNMDVENMEKDYLPLKWTVIITTTNGKLTDTAETAKFTIADGQTSTGEVKFDSLADIGTALSKVTVAFDPNETCDVDVQIKWEWPFEETKDTYTAQDKMDTILGYYIAQTEGRIENLPFTASGITAAEGETAVYAITTVSYDFSMTATQVD